MIKNFVSCITGSRVTAKYMLCVCFILSFSFSLVCIAQKQDVYDFNSYAPKYSYKVLDIKYISTADVQITLNVYDSKKKEIEKDAQRSAIRAVLYDGVGNGVYARPLLPDGEQTSFQKNPDYLYNLYENRRTDFIGKFNVDGKFKKADDQKGTKYIIVVHALKLRKDLEKNNLKRKVGL